MASTWASRSPVVLVLSRLTVALMPFLTGLLLTIEQGLGLGKLGNTSDAAQIKPMWPLIIHGRR